MKEIKKIYVYLLTPIVISLLSISFKSATKRFDKSQKTNILLILSDDHGYNDMGFQGSTEVPTPQLDQLAREGLRCTNGYVSFPYYSPSRAGLLTGRYQERFGHERNPRNLPNDYNEGLPATETLLPEVLAKAGYATAWIGKWHLGMSKPFYPEKRGFQYTYGFLSGSHNYYNWKPDTTKEYNYPILENGKPVDVDDHLTLAFGHKAAAFIEKNQGHPWFLYLAFNAPHTPHQPTPERLAQFARIENKERAKYLAQVSLMDDAIGETLDRLRKTGQKERTLVLFLSDNGGLLYDNNGKPLGGAVADNDPLRAGKGHMFEGGVRVPFVVSWPGTLPTGKDYNQTVSSIDIFATSLAVAGIPMPTDKSYDGVNLIPYLKGKNNGKPHEVLFWRRDDWQLAGMCMRNMKLVRDIRRSDQVFNLTTDIGEKTDIAVENLKLTKEMEDTLDAWMNTMPKRFAFHGAGEEQQEWPERNPPKP